MSNTYGHALYYPYIHIRDENWLKTAALYYDGLSRIVPEQFKTDDSDIVKILNDRVGFISDVDPGPDAVNIARDFLTYARRELANPQKRKGIVQRIGHSLPSDSGFTIHVDKIAMLLRAELPKYGLAKKISGQSGWFDFEPVTGAIYMTHLANKIAERRGLPVVTDDPIYQPLIRSAQADHIEGKIDKGHALASLIIKTAIPENIEAISINSIIEFRKRHNDERHSFYEGIRGLAKDIPAIEDPDALQDCLNHHKKSIDTAVRNLKFSLKSVGIPCITGLLGLSVPSWATKLAESQPGMGIAASGIVIMAAGILMEKGVNYYKSKKESPWSYVLSLKKLNSKRFINDLYGGSVLI